MGYRIWHSLTIILKSQGDNYGNCAVLREARKISDDNGLSLDVIFGIEKYNDTDRAVAKSDLIIFEFDDADGEPNKGFWPHKLMKRYFERLCSDKIAFIYCEDHYPERDTPFLDEDQSRESFIHRTLIPDQQYLAFDKYGRLKGVTEFIMKKRVDYERDIPSLLKLINF